MFPLTLRYADANTNTYYVAPNGRDTNPGTMQAPFQTLKHVASVVKAGDTVYFRGGTYKPTAANWIAAKGTSSSWITFQSYPGERAVIDASGQPANTDGFAIGGSYIEVSGFEIKNAPRIGINVWGGSHIRIRNNIIHGSQKQAIWAGHNDFTTTNDILIEGNTAYNNVRRNSNPNNAGMSDHDSVVSSQQASNVRFINNVVYQNYGEGINPVLTKGGVISGNIVYDNYSANIYLDNATDFLVERNFVYTKNDPRFYTYSQPSPSLQIATETYRLSNPSANITAINNIMYGNRFNFSYGDYLSGGGLRNLVFAQNTLVKATESAIHIDGTDKHHNALFFNNVIDQTGGGAKLLSSWTGKAGYNQLTFRNNLWYGAPLNTDTTGPGDVNAAPQLVNPGGQTPEDYRLRVGSPAITAGQSTQAVTKDFWGAQRNSTPDLGAHEFSSTPPQTVTPQPGVPPSPCPATLSRTAQLTGTPIGEQANNDGDNDRDDQDEEKAYLPLIMSLKSDNC